MSLIERCLAKNSYYAAEYERQEYPLATRHLAVVACMDARMDVYRILGLKAGEAYVIRNAGGVITDDQLRSLTIAQHKFGVREIILLHHTECGMVTFDEESFKNELFQETGIVPRWSVECFTDPKTDVTQSLRRIAVDPFLNKIESVRGFVLSLETGILEEVTQKNP